MRLVCLNGVIIEVIILTFDFAEKRVLPSVPHPLLNLSIPAGDGVLGSSQPGEQGQVEEGHGGQGGGEACLPCCTAGDRIIR